MDVLCLWYKSTFDLGPYFVNTQKFLKMLTFSFRYFNQASVMVRMWVHMFSAHLKASRQVDVNAIFHQAVCSCCQLGITEWVPL